MTTNGASNGYHAPVEAQCHGCKVATVATRQNSVGWWVTLNGADGGQLTQMPCDTEDEARAVASLAREAHGARYD